MALKSRVSCSLLKFRFSKKATKFETISHIIWRLLSTCQIKWDIVSNFCGLFRMSELYFSYIFHFLFVLMEILWEKGYWFARNVTPVYSIWAIVRLRKEYILLASRWCFCHGISIQFYDVNSSTYMYFNSICYTL